MLAQVIHVTRMKHVIRVADSTFEELIKRAGWFDTMNDVICRLLETHMEKKLK
jgi:hypothetical protein